MTLIGNGFEKYYYIDDAGNVFSTASNRYIKPDKKRLLKLKMEGSGYKCISLKNLYKMVFNKPFCKDSIEDLEGEEWKEVSGTNGFYLVSNLGRVKSLQGYEAMILKPYPNQRGYLRVDIIQEGTRISKLVHKLVANEWLPIPSKMDWQIHHKDFCLENNAASNLEYLSVIEHAQKHKERKMMNGNKSSEPKSDNSKKGSSE